MKNLGNNIFSDFQHKSFGVSLGPYYVPCKNRWEIVSKSAVGNVLLEATNCDESAIDCVIQPGSDLPSLTTMPPTTSPPPTTQNPNTGTTGFTIEYVNFYEATPLNFVYESRITFDQNTANAYQQYANDNGISFLMFEATFQAVNSDTEWTASLGPIYPNQLSQLAYYSTTSGGQPPVKIGEQYAVIVKDVFNNLGFGMLISNI
tara:strand:+ start:1105 stop:1716 length:612 start_codon:yes stop_codon:yes gene_type:complete